MSWIRTYVEHWNWWEAIGWLGQAMFFGRFFLQWLVSERKQRSVIPFHFWTLSISGSALLLVYLIHAYVTTKTSLPLIVGQLTGMFIYTRNLMLLKKEKAGTA